MKKTILLSAYLLTAASALFAQTLTVSAPGYSVTKLFDASPGFVIGGLAVAPGGDIYYIESDSDFTAPSRLCRRSPGDGYTAAMDLFNFGASIFGSFVRWENGKVFFGENSSGAIRVLNPNLTIDPLGTVPGNYDMSFAGGRLYLSHNPGGFSPRNKVSRFDLLPDGGGGLMLGTADLILDTPSDYSGPLIFDATGQLFYGGSGAFGQPDLYRFSAAEVQAADGAGPTQPLDLPHRFLANGGNAYLAYDGAQALWQSNFGTLARIDLTVPGSSAIAVSPDFGIGQLEFVDGTLFVAVTNASYTQAAIYAVVPEPSVAALWALGFAVLTRRRRWQS
ncbi:MAG: hypothetical protein K8R23_00365 [Chthoniobacter sp.]|nr:hypothetical protein [Chthoniobacter sp.]